MTYLTFIFGTEFTGTEFTGTKFTGTEFTDHHLAVTLDSSLSYKKHIGNVMQKLKKRTNLIRKISGTSWGAPQAVLRTSAMALCYSVAEYAAPVWARSCHARKVDVSLNETMCMISGIHTERMASCNEQY